MAAIPFEKVVTEDLNLGYGSATVTMPGGGTAAGAKVGIHSLLGPACLNVRDFGAVGDGVTDDIVAFEAAVAVLAARTLQAGVIIIPEGTYFLSRTWDLTSLVQVTVLGYGAFASILKTAVTTTAGMTVAATSSKPSRLSGFALWQQALVLPAVARTGNYGMACAATGTGAGLQIHACEVRYFGDAGILIQGPTGPTIIEDTYIYYCSAYGIKLVTVSTSSPQDVSIVRGAIQTSWGGVYLGAGLGCHVMDTDIELGTDGQLPAVRLTAGSVGCTLTNITASVGNVLIAPAGVVTIDAGSFGNTVVGGIHFALHASVANFLIDGAGTFNTTIIGPECVGAGTGGSSYPFVISSATNTVILQPALTATYETAKRKVSDLAANFTTSIGIASVGHGENQNNSAGLPFVHTDKLALLDGVTAPAAVSGLAILFVDVADGDLKVIFGDGTTKVISADT